MYLGEKKYNVYLFLSRMLFAFGMGLFFLAVAWGVFTDTWEVYRHEGFYPWLTIAAVSFLASLTASVLHMFGEDKLEEDAWAKVIRHD